MGLFDNLLVEKYRPKTLDDIVLSDDNRKFFEQINKKQEIPHLMLSGAPGIGKTTLAKTLVTDVLDCQFIIINASEESGIDVIRQKIMNFANTRSIDGKIKIVIADEADGLSSVSGGKGRSSAQQSLRNVMEEYAETTRFILTCNYPYKIIPALHSRCQTIDLTPPYEGCVKRCSQILKAEGISVDDENKVKLLELVKKCYPDIRKVINTIQKNTIDGVLNITSFESNLEFANTVADKLIKGKDVMRVRKFVIENEISFDPDVLVTVWHISLS